MVVNTFIYKTRYTENYRSSIKYETELSPINRYGTIGNSQPIIDKYRKDPFTGPIQYVSYDKQDYYPSFGDKLGSRRPILRLSILGQSFLDATQRGLYGFENSVEGKCGDFFAK